MVPAVVLLAIALAGAPGAIAAVSSNYKPTLAKKLVLLSDAAYCGDATHGGTDGITGWTCAPCRAGAALTNVSIFDSPEQQTLGFVGVTDGWEEGLYVVVTFRGSVLRRNYIDDYMQFPVPSPSGRAGWVHLGMYLSFASLKEEMLKHVRDLLAQLPMAKGIVVTGHSLGAAQAVFGADELANALPHLEVVLYSFGTPRVGSSAFVQRLSSTPNLHAWAVAHRADTVPECGIYSAPCPVSQLVFRQLARSVWYPDGLATAGPEGYVLCNGEDPRCQNGLNSSLLNWRDHDLYFGHTMYCCDGGDHGGRKDGCHFPFNISKGGTSDSTLVYA